MKKILTVIGARPQFIKHAPVQKALRREFKEITVHTGQHYDERMSDIFFRELKIRKPEYNLEVGSLTHGAQTGLMMERLEKVIMKEKPDMVVIYGDTNSTVAASLTAAKLHIPVSHIEAGLRSFNMMMPEEINRIVADRLSELLFAPTKEAVKNLKRENLKSIMTGDVMYDAFLYFEKMAERINISDLILGLRRKSYVYMTIHREDNTLLTNMKRIIKNVQKIKYPVIFPVHPRTQKVLNRLFEVRQGRIGNINLIEPQGYLDNLALLKGAAVLVTDSGGLQKEAYFAKVGTITVRSETEWIETVESGNNVLCPFADGIDGIVDVKRKIKYRDYYGDGKASEKISLKIKEFLCR